MAQFFLKKSNEIKPLALPMPIFDMEQEFNPNALNQPPSVNEIVAEPIVIPEPIADIPMDSEDPNDVNSYLKNFLVLLSGWLSNYFNSLLEK